MKTITSLYRELEKLIPAHYAYSRSNRDGCRVSAQKMVQQYHDPWGKSQETRYAATITWEVPPDGHGRLFVMGMGKTPRQAYRKLIEDLQQTLSKRALFQLNGQCGDHLAERTAVRLGEPVKLIEGPR